MKIISYNLIMRVFKKFEIYFWPCSENNFYPKFLESRFLFSYLFFLIFLKFILFPVIIFFPKSSFFAEISKNILFALVNETRKEKNISPLKEDPLLTFAAQLKAKDMIERQYFSHQDPEGNPPWEWLKKVGYDFKLAGENLAIGFLDSEEVFGAWKNSYSHRENLLNPNFEEMGIGIAKGKFQGAETTVVVQFFGTKKSKNLSPQIVTIAPEEKTKKKSTPNLAKENLAPTSTKKIPEKPKESTTSQTALTIPSPEIAMLETTTLAGTMPETTTSKPEFLKEESKAFFQQIQLGTFSFLSLLYPKVIDVFVYLNIASILFILFVAVISDLFVYRRFAIDYGDLIPKTLTFLAVLIILLSFDKNNIISAIPHNFHIY